MVNVMNQLMSRFDQLDRAQASSAAAHASTPLVNYANTPASPSHPPVSIAPSMRAPKVHDLTPHPGLDARGPFWHPQGAQFACNYAPCTTLFCQGCGRHGHTSAECLRKAQPGWECHRILRGQSPGPRSFDSRWSPNAHGECSSSSNCVFPYSSSHQYSKQR